MAIKHYYIEDKNVDPKRENRIDPVHSIQFDLLPDREFILATIEQPIGDGKKWERTSIIIPLEELKNAYHWLYA
jgi:hypothetical protein